jgi:hypothetical protein
MTTFVEAEHPRHRDGKFSEKPNTAPASSLTAEAGARTDRVVFVVYVSGDPEQPGSFGLEMFDSREDADYAREALEQSNPADGRVYSVVPQLDGRSERCACTVNNDGSVYSILCREHADSDPCFTFSRVTGKRRKGTIRAGKCTNCGWSERA